MYTNPGERMKKILALCLASIVIAGCQSAPDAANTYTGSTVATLDSVAKNHVTETKVIEEEAKKLLTRSRTIKTRESAANILASNGKLKAAGDVLADEVVAKKATSKLIKDQAKYIEKLESKERRTMNRAMLILKLIGLIFIAGGLWAGFYMGKIFFSAAGFGLVLIVSSSVLKVIDKFSMVIGIIVILGTILFIVKLYLSKQLTLKSTVKVAEVLKQELKERAPEVVETIFGKGDKPAVIAMAPEAEKQVSQVRKQIRKEIAKEDFKKKKESV